MSSSVLPTSSNSQTESLLHTICDKVTSKPYKNAQILNCKSGHSLSLDSAIERFGTLVENSNKCRKPGECPLCNRKVTKYRPNPDLQALVDSILALLDSKFDVRELKLTVDANKLVFEALIKKNLEENFGIYPLSPSNFCVKTNYDDIYGTGTILRSFSNKKSNLNCIRSFSLCYSRNKSRQLDFVFQSYSLKSKLKQFFERFEGLKVINCSDYISETNSEENIFSFIINSKDDNQLMEMINLIVQHNNFDEEAQVALATAIENIKNISRC